MQRWIRAGLVLHQGRAAKAGTEVKPGDLISWEPPPPVDLRVLPEAGELLLLHVDESLIVVDKPAGIAVHPGAGRTTGTLVHRLLARFPELALVGGAGRPGIVHRLDLGTSGVMLVARTPEAYRRLTRDFAARRIAKTYLAIVWGTPRQAQGRIEVPLGRHPTKRQLMTVSGRGRAATTSYTVVAATAGLSLLLVMPTTGRTHQIRVHLRHLGHPLVGDTAYGEGFWRRAPVAHRALLRDFPRPALHALALELNHPATAEPMRLCAAPPADLRQLWEAVSGASWPELTAPARAPLGSRS